MKLLVLAVDGLDPDYANELGYPKLPYEAKLSIPKELYYNGVPATQFIFPSMFSGRIIKSKIKRREISLFRKKIRLPIRKFLHKHNIKWYRKSPLNKKGPWGINPVNSNIKTIADRYNSIMWNVPTICPEFICIFPNGNEMLRYGMREYEVWKVITFGLCFYNYDLGIAYCHLPDILGHLKKPLKHIYLDIRHHTMKLSKYCSIMLVSDHGTSSERGTHTDHAYLGSTRPIKAKSVLDVSSNIELILSDLLKLSEL